MSLLLACPTNIEVAVDNKSVRATWTPVAGADGYVLQYYTAANPDCRYKLRYAEGSSKKIFGFKNGIEYFVTISSLVRDNGKEIWGEPSAPIHFTPMAVELTAQKTLCMSIGETHKLSPEYRNTIPSVDYQSKNTSIATVDIDGNVTALSEGTTSIIISMENGNEFVTSVIVERNLFRNPKQEITINIVGDLMCSSKAQQRFSANGYDFTELFSSEITTLLSSATYTAGVLETMCYDNAPFESEMLRLPSGSANCNSPSTFLHALKDAGFNGLFTANNHNCDTGISGLKATRSHILSLGMNHIGSLSDNPIIRKFGSLRVAFINLSLVSNGLDGISDNPTTELARYTDEYYLSLVHTAQDKKADFIIVMMHWGLMNSQIVSERQRTVARFMAENGADVILGSEPHVMQEYESISTSDGRSIPCIYSLGNFYTCMKELYGNTVSAIAQIKLRLDRNVVMSKLNLIPTLCLENGTDGYSKLYPVYPITSQAKEKAASYISELYPEELIQRSDSPFKDVSSTHSCIFYMGSEVNSPVTKEFEKNSIPFIGDIKLLDKCAQMTPDTYVLMDLFSFASSKNMSKSVDSFLSSLTKIIPSDHIILIKNQVPSTGVKRNQLRDCKVETELNRRLNSIATHIINVLHPIVIDISQYYFRDIEDIKVIRYESYYYVHLAEIVNDILTKVNNRFCYSEPNTSLWLKRVCDYHENMTARAYQSRILNTSDATDIIAAASSSIFIQTFQEELCTLKELKVELPYIENIITPDEENNDFFQAINAIRSIRANDISQITSYSNVLFKYNFTIIKTLASLVSSYTGYHVASSNLEEILPIITDNEKLTSYFEQNPVYDIDIWGSCISRETINHCAARLNVCNYIFKEIPVFFSNPPAENVTIPDNVDAFCGNRWRMTTIHDAFNHNGKSRILGTDSTWIIVDFYDLICNMNKLGDTIFEVDNFIKRTDFYHSIRSSCKPTLLFKELSMEEISSRIESFADFLLNIYGEHIILVIADLKDTYIDLDGVSKRFSNTLDYEDKKTCIQNAEETFIRKTNCHIVDCSKKYMASDLFPLGGAHIVHYENSFYDEAADTIYKIISNA